MNYTLIKNPMTDSMYREGYNTLANDTYGLSFDSWYNSGHFDGSHMPYTLFDGHKAISNISINFMDVVFDGQVRKYVQIGTVMTDKAYRGKGLQKVIFNKIFEDLKGKCDALFLFANASVLEFYPKFGFEKAVEFSFTKTVTGKGEDHIKLDTRSADDVETIKNHYQLGNPFSAFSVVNGFALEMFYLGGPYSNCVYYLPKQDAVVVAEKEDHRITVLEILCSADRNLEDILSSLSTGQTEISLGFTPKDTTGWETRLLEDEDTTLFVHKDGENVFNGRQLLFPLIAHT